jgi:hypothetical protein
MADAPVHVARNGTKNDVLIVRQRRNDAFLCMTICLPEGVTRPLRPTVRSFARTALFPRSQQDPQQVPSLQVKSTFCVSDQPLDSPPRESARLGPARTPWVTAPTPARSRTRHPSSFPASPGQNAGPTSPRFRSRYCDIGRFLKAEFDRREGLWNPSLPRAQPGRCRTAGDPDRRAGVLVQLRRHSPLSCRYSFMP